MFCRVVYMNSRSILLPFSLLAAGCAQAPQDEAATEGQVVDQVIQTEAARPAAPEEVEPAALPEVRYYLIADT